MSHGRLTAILAQICTKVPTPWLPRLQRCLERLWARGVPHKKVGYLTNQSRQGLLGSGFQTEGKIGAAAVNETSNVYFEYYST